MLECVIRIAYGIVSRICFTSIKLDEFHKHSTIPPTAETFADGFEYLFHTAKLQQRLMTSSLSFGLREIASKACFFGQMIKAT